MDSISTMEKHNYLHVEVPREDAGVTELGEGNSAGKPVELFLSVGSNSGSNPDPGSR